MVLFLSFLAIVFFIVACIAKAIVKVISIGIDVLLVILIFAILI